MSSFPDDVEAYYAELAQRREWSAETIRAIRSAVELIRDLDRGAAPRTYGALADDAGTDWLYEAVWHEREWVVVRQLGAAEDGAITRYWWQRLEDDDGMLTDQALDRDEWVFARSAGRTSTPPGTTRAGLSPRSSSARAPAVLAAHHVAPRPGRPSYWRLALGLGAGESWTPAGAAVQVGVLDVRVSRHFTMLWTTCGRLPNVMKSYRVIIS